MNTHLRRTFYLFAAGFVALIGVLAYWQVYAAESLANNPNNAFQTQRDQQAPRGLILARDGETVLAESREETRTNAADQEETVYERAYPQGAPFANITGYWSTRYGASGLEVLRNTELSGSGDPETVDELLNQMSGGPQPGNNLRLTIDPELQRAAYEGLAATDTGRGSAVALNPQTGEILALASYPSFDPNNIDDAFPELSEDPDAPLINRATQALYPPGSTFKTITAAAALEAGVNPQREFFDSGRYETPGYAVTNYKGRDYGEVTFTRSLVLSINAIFAEIGVEIVGAQRLADLAREFGYGDEYTDFALPVKPSSLGIPVSRWAPGYTAQISFGQGQNLSNVFEMALVAGTVANDGAMMEPRLVEEVRSPDGVILDDPAPTVRREVLPEQTANELTEMMEAVVTEGGLTQAQIPGVQVAGKTGTAEAPPGDPHSWWITFAPADDPQIAVAVMVENGGALDEEGNASTPAIPIATDIMRAYLDDGDQDATQGRPGG